MKDFEEIYTGGGITIYIKKLDENNYLVYEDGDNDLTLFDEDYNFEWDYEDEMQHVKAMYELGSKEYMDLIEKHFKEVYRGE